MKNTRMISLLVPIISVILAFIIGCIIMPWRCRLSGRAPSAA